MGTCELNETLDVIELVVREARSVLVRKRSCLLT